MLSMDVVRLLTAQLMERSEALGRERLLRDAAEQKVAQSAANSRDVSELVLAMAGGRKIDAIKLYRQMTGTFLKDAKDAVERVMDQIPRRDPAS